MVNDLDGPFRKTFTPENLSSFSWDKTTSWAEEKAPLTVACLRAMFPPTKKIQKQKLSYVRGNNQRWVKVWFMSLWTVVLELKTWFSGSDSI